MKTGGRLAVSCRTPVARVFNVTYEVQDRNRVTAWIYCRYSRVAFITVNTTTLTAR